MWMVVLTLAVGSCPPPGVGPVAGLKRRLAMKPTESTGISRRHLLAMAGETPLFAKGIERHALRQK